MMANQTECFRLEQRSVIDFLVAEKCKPCGMCTEKNVLVQKRFTNWLNVDLPLYSGQ